jgi:NAD-dependent SIR2 family protein deacetylase
VETDPARALLGQFSVPHCDAKAHSQSEPEPADYLVDWHGCHQRWACNACMVAVQTAFEEFLEREPGARIACKDCNRLYPTFGEFITNIRKIDA